MNQEFESWNSLLDIRIRPLRSKNARTIFQLFLEMSHEKALTTLEIEKRLKETGINLDKKEINGWLSSLLEAGLISKEKNRGKPTTFQYDGKYTFDLWKITPVGINIAHGMTHFSKQDATFMKLDSKSVLRSIQNMNIDEINKIFRQINELDIISQILTLMSKGPFQISSFGIAEGLRISPEKIEGILDGYLENSEPHMFVRRTSPYGIKERFRNILGLPTRTTFYSLTEEGKRLAVLFRRS